MLILSVVTSLKANVKLTGAHETDTSQFAAQKQIHILKYFN